MSKWSRLPAWNTKRGKAQGRGWSMGRVATKRGSRKLKKHPCKCWRSLQSLFEMGSKQMWSLRQRTSLSCTGTELRNADSRNSSGGSRSRCAELLGCCSGQQGWAPGFPVLSLPYSFRWSPQLLLSSPAQNHVPCLWERLEFLVNLSWDSYFEQSFCKILWFQQFCFEFWVETCAQCEVHVLLKKQAEVFAHTSES